MDEVMDGCGAMLSAVVALEATMYGLQRDMQRLKTARDVAKAEVGRLQTRLSSLRSSPAQTPPSCLKEHSSAPWKADAQCSSPAHIPPREAWGGDAGGHTPKSNKRVSWGSDTGSEGALAREWVFAELNNRESSTGELPCPTDPGSGSSRSSPETRTEGPKSARGEQRRFTYM